MRSRSRVWLYRCSWPHLFRPDLNPLVCSVPARSGPTGGRTGTWEPGPVQTGTAGVRYSNGANGRRYDPDSPLPPSHHGQPVGNSSPRHDCPLLQAGILTTPPITPLTTPGHSCSAGRRRTGCAIDSVGTGSSERERADLAGLLSLAAATSCSFTPEPWIAGTHSVLPRLVGEIKYISRTRPTTCAPS